jgi:hypothetical protein
MQRTVSEAEVGDRLVRYRTKIIDDPSAPNSWQARLALFNLFQTFLNTPDLINCGLHTPQKMNLVHSGEAWVLELEATVESGA